MLSLVATISRPTQFIPLLALNPVISSGGPSRLSGGASFVLAFSTIRSVPTSRPASAHISMQNASAAHSEKVLVTGASGFLGSHCCQQLQKKGYNVRGTIRSLNDAKKVALLRGLCPDAAFPLELVEASLLDEESWIRAVADCTYVLHTASPFPTEEPEDEQTLINPAVNGTLNVLRGCREAKTVKRVVLTSCVQAITGQQELDYSKTYKETDWSNTNGPILPYAKSKTLAEKAAWKFVQNLPETEKLELTVINPCYMMGPVIHGSPGASQILMQRLMKGEVPALPLIALEMCDVRDVAAGHISAMTSPAAAGNRHIIQTGVLWFKDCALILSKEFAPQGYKVPTINAPKFMIWAGAKVDKSLQVLLPRWGKEIKYDSTKMRTVLDIQPIKKENTVLDMAYSMVESGLLPKTTMYKKRA